MLLHVLLMALPDEPRFDGAEIFERLAHFKFAGLKEVGSNSLGIAAIADGTCRLIAAKPFDGYYFWRQPTKAREVTATLGALPFTADAALQHPSNFTLSAVETLAKNACVISGEVPEAASNYSLEQYSSAMQHWYHSLCAPPQDSSWSPAGYDPANQPQQRVITIGLVCIAACDLSHYPLPATTLAAALEDTASATSTLCNALPWDASHSADFFTRASSKADLAHRAAPLTKTPCICGPGSNAPGGSMPSGVYTTIVIAIIAALLLCGAKSCRTAMWPQNGSVSTLAGRPALANTLLAGGGGMRSDDAAPSMLTAVEEPAPCAAEASTC